MLTVDLQFAWFCWSLENGISKLNDTLVTMLAEPPQVRRTKVTRQNYKSELVLKITQF